MRIAMIGPFGLWPKGTMAARALPLAKALLRRGHKLAIFLPPWSNPSDAGRRWEEDGVRVENVAISPRIAIPPRLVAHALRWRPDVVHCFKPKAYSGVSHWLLWQGRRAGRVQARIVLDTDDWEGRGGWNDLENYTPAQKRFFEWQEQWGLRHADAVTAGSRALETIVLSMGRRRDQVHYLPNGPNPMLLAATTNRASIRARYGLSDDPVALLYTRFFEFRVERLVEIFNRIVQRVPNARLLVVGEGLFGEEEELLAAARARGWDSRVVYAGWVETAELRAHFAAADVALYPFDDTLVNRCKCPVKLTDLLAAGVPVVAEAVGQTREYITHNETGLLVAPDDTEGFANAVVRLMRDPELRTRLGSCAAATMARDYNWDRLATLAEVAYAGALRRR